MPGLDSSPVRRANRGLPADLGRSDLPGIAALGLLACAAVLAGPRDVLLALAVVAAVAWIGVDAARTDRPGPRARLVMTLALGVLAALPAVLLGADHGLWAGLPVPNFDAGLALWALGIVALAAGARIVSFVLAGRPDDSAADGEPAGPGAITLRLRTAEPRGRRAQAVVAAIVLLSLAAFMKKVGGPVAYVKNLNNSGAETSGLTYFIWGISFAKFAAYLALGERWRSGGSPSRWLIALTGFALVLLLFLGSRLLLLVALIQLFLLYAALRPVGRRFRTLAAASALLGVVLFVVIGEFRRWENVPRPRPGFPAYLVDTGLPNMVSTYVNDYADAVRLSVLVRQTVPRHAGYEYGKELLRVLVHPIPSAIRPKIGQARALASTFTSGNKNGNALPVPVEGYIEFGLAGTIAFSLLLGAFVAGVDRLGSRARDVGWLAAATAAGTGAVIILRGSLAAGISLAAIDVIGFLIVHRLLFRRLTEAETTAAATAGDGADRPAVATPQLMSAAPQPGVSVVVPTVNRDTLGPALEAIARAALHVPEPVELIVVDDRPGEDGGPEVPTGVVSRLATRVLRSGGAGAAAARNLGVAAAAYDVLAFIDDDVRCDEQWLAVALARLRADSSLAGVEGAVRLDPESELDPVRARLVVNLSGGAFLTASLFARTQAARRVGGFRPLGRDLRGRPFPYREDTDFALRLITEAGPVPFVPAAFTLHPPEAVDLRRLVRLGGMFVADAAFARRHPEAVPAIWRRPLARARIRLATGMIALVPAAVLRRTRRPALLALLASGLAISVQFEVELRAAGLARTPERAIADTIVRLPRSLLWGLAAGLARVRGEALVRLRLMTIPER